MTAIATGTRYVYDFAEGSRDMRVLLGGKGANIAEMTRVLGPDLVPAGFTITTEACVAFMRDGPGRARRAGRAGGRGRRAARGAHRPHARRRRRTRCWSRCARARATRCRACSRRSSTSASTTSPCRGWRRTHRRRALRVGLLPALRADVRQRRARRSRRALRGDPRARPGGEPACARTAHLDVAAAAGHHAPLPHALRGPHGRAVPPGSAGAAALGRPRRLRLVAGRPRGAVPPHQSHPRRLGHRGQRPADGVRQPRCGIGDRRRVLARRADRRARAQRRLPARRPGRGRRLRRAHAAPAARAGGRAAGGARAAAARSCARSRPTTATCRTPSSRSSATASTCCRRAAPSARPRPPSASPSTPSTKAC